ncbi:helix-turn-helix domain-containing protein [[Ruminococcus] lactaris]|uniref:helix-turn-helix domain-containing protein n=1 Tax=[Ruminococcus] lactaris TaxID=46228 RepID=UPI0039A129F1
MDYKLLGKNIKEARKSLKMTQEQLAEQIDVSTVFISQIENGSRKPSLETIYKISIALKIKIDTLINNDTADENIRDIEKLIELLSRCSPSERDFVTDISREVIIKLMEHKILN